MAHYATITRKTGDPVKVTVASDDRNDRRRERLLDIDWYAVHVVEQGEFYDAFPRVDCYTGGTVCNSYGWPAVTDAVVVCALSLGRVVVWATEIPANKATEAGAAEAAFGCTGRPLFDARYGREAKDEAFKAIVDEARQIVHEGV